MPNRAATTAALLSATFMVFLDVSIVNVASPAIRQSLDASTGSVELVASVYTLTFACVLIAAGRLGDRYGYRRLYAIGMATFTLASALCALSFSITWLIGARALQGLGAGVMAPQVLSIIQRAFPAQQRGRLFAAYGSAIGLATVTGPVLGGLLIQLRMPGFDWRLVFAINLPVGIAALWGLRLLPVSPHRERTTLDPIGTVLAVAGLVLLVYPLAMGHSAGWPWWLITMICAAPVALAILVAHQLSRQRRGRWPLLKLVLLRDPGFRAGLVAVAAFFAGVPPFFFFLSVYLQAGFGHSALVAGLTQLPFAAATGAASRWSAPLTARLGRAVLVKATGTLALSMLVLAAIVVTRGADARPWELAVPMALGGACFGVFTTTAFTSALAHVPPDATGSASGLLTTVQQAAGSIGLTLGGLVFYSAASTSDSGAVRDGHVSGFAHLLSYEAVVFVLACAASLALDRQRATSSRTPATVSTQK
ncbi:MFS transporter [Amycolatopsis minnesotensis]|uniref:MFS transporter n=1 Tax=Amycolatopsis minnesotensis TaxID=337894 RepID=A0ABN2Q078_9PSEU